RLREGLVDAGDENHELGIFGRELVVRDAVERAGFVDRMYDGPAEREEGDARAFQPELVVAAGRTFDAAEQNLGLELDELIAARVGDAKHEGRDVTVRRDDGALAEPEHRRRPREAREQDSRRHREE